MIKIVVNGQEFKASTSAHGSEINVYCAGHGIAHAIRNSLCETLDYIFYTEQEGQITDMAYNDELFAAPVEIIARFLIGTHPGF